MSFFIAAFLVFFILSIFFTANRAFDEDYPSETVRIMNKEISCNKGTHHRLIVFYEGKEYTLSVSEQTYIKYSVGEAFPVTPSEGFFGIAYLEYER